MSPLLSPFRGWGQFKKHNTMKKKQYTAPAIEIIFLDNEISLALESTPPIGPDETNLNASKYLNNNPFKAILS